VQRDLLDHPGLAGTADHELERESGSRISQPQAPAAPPPKSPPPAASSPAEPELPELDDDLFGEPSGDTAEPPFSEAAAPDDEPADDLFSDDLDDFVDFEPPSLLGRLRAKLPMRIVVIAAVALVVTLAGVWLGSDLLPAKELAVGIMAGLAADLLVARVVLAPALARLSLQSTSVSA